MAQTMKTELRDFLEARASTGPGSYVCASPGEMIRVATLLLDFGATFECDENRIERTWSLCATVPDGRIVIIEGPSGDDFAGLCAHLTTPELTSRPTGGSPV